MHAPAEPALRLRRRGVRLASALGTAAAFALASVLCACGDATETPVAPVASPHAAAGPSAPSPSAPADVLSDQWYEVFRDGRKTAWFHMVWTRSSFEGRPSIHDRTESVSASTRLMDGTEDVFEGRSVTDLERTEDGRLLLVLGESAIGDRVVAHETRWTGAGYRRTERVAGLEEVRDIPCAEPVPVDAEAFLAPLAQGGTLAVGATMEFPSLDFEARRLRAVRLEVQALDDVTTPGGSDGGDGTVRCFRVRQTVEGRPGTTTWWLDLRGVLVKVVEGPTEIVRSTQERARRLAAAEAPFEITVPADPAFARCTSATRTIVDVEVTRRPGGELPDFPETPFSRVASREGDVIRMELRAHDAPGATTTLPVRDPAVAKWLESTNLYTPQHPAVQAAMRRAVGDTTDGREAARRILRYVFTSLGKASGPVPQPTTVEILEAGMGDCSEHCVLFVALCRAAGLPARRLSGYALVGDVWGAHSFAEVWLGRWVGADPTTNELGTAARYVAFGWDEDPDSFPDEVAARATGKIRLRTVSFEEGGDATTVAAAALGEPLRDRLSGLAFAAPPEGWTVDATPGLGATVAGPGVVADVQCTWGGGDLDVELLHADGFPGTTRTEFAGQPAARHDMTRTRYHRTAVSIPWRRRIVHVQARITKGTDVEDALASLAALVAPTFAAPK